MSRTMEVPVAALAILVFIEPFFSQACSAPLGIHTPTPCCFFYISRKIPRQFVDDYYKTSSQCSKPAVIFKTKRGRHVCADPREAWVQKYISNLELNVRGV